MGFKGRRTIGKMSTGRRKLELVWSRREEKKVVPKPSGLIAAIKKSPDAGSTKADK